MSDDVNVREMRQADLERADRTLYAEKRAGKLSAKEISTIA